MPEITENTRLQAPTLADRLLATGGRPSGFDYLRLSLSVLIICYHSVITSYGTAAQLELNTGPLRPFIALLLPMFFALSGFLVAGSLERTRTLGMFLGLRAIRIFPALAVESMIAALLLGPLLTSLTLSNYVGDPLFRSYFLNILGMPQFFLPGVFATNPEPSVNAQLWTIPYELECYITLAVPALLGAVRRPGLLLAVILLLTAKHIFETATQRPYLLSGSDGVLPGWMLVQSFLLGVLASLWRDRLPWHWGLGLGAFVAAIVLLALPYGLYPAILPIAYLTVWLGLTNAPRIGIIRGADYSYGIFLYGFIIQQTFVHLFPGGRIWWLNILVSVPAAAAVAALSWHLVEKPALGLRTSLARWEDKWLARRAISRPLQ